MDTGARQRFGRYETLFRIASGGMAEVYVARALGEGGFQKIVALKRMRPELAEDARFVTMFLDEGRVAANIASPHVVSTLDLGRAEDNSLYLVMELVTGASLQTLMFEAGEGPIPLSIAIDLIAQAAQGLHDAHEALSPSGEPLDIIHRDCSPHNILVDVKGQVKITDFGIAKALERQTESQVGDIKGKLAYLSPEQARGLTVDRRTDIFILGIVAWEIVAGRQLFVADHPVEALYKVGNMPIPVLTEVRPDVSPDIAAAIAQALERDPDARFSTALAFGNALQNASGKPPSRTQIATLVRKRGGETLASLERGIKEALRKKPDSQPERADVARPPSEPPVSRQRRRTTPLGSPQSEERALGVGDHDTEIDVRPEVSEAIPIELVTRAIAPTEPASVGVAWQESAEQPAIPLSKRAAPRDDPSRGPRGTAVIGPALPASTEFPEPERPRWPRTLGIALTLIAFGIGAAAIGVWWSGRNDDERVEIQAPPAPPPEPAAPDPIPPDPIPTDPSPPAPDTNATAPIAPEPPVAAPPEKARRPRPPRRNPRPAPRDPSVPTVRGSDAPAGDRAETFEEIPWERSGRE